MLCDRLPDIIPAKQSLGDHQRAVLSHRLRCLQAPGRIVAVNDRFLTQLHLNDPLPAPAEQADRLIQWIAGHQPSAAESAESAPSEIEAWIGTAILPNSPGAVLGWLLGQDDVKELVQTQPVVNNQIRLKLTLRGWSRYEALKRASINSQIVFMAMKFDDPELNGVVEDHLKPAVQRAGFELRLLSDGQPAGLIDDQLRVRLRTSRFTIADLTHANNGAYWEAGFAEGLGRPVIYTCRKKEWDERRVHFDTNHLATVIWDPANPDEAAQRLTAMIRATLPAEAKMTD